jgi:PKD repeat protein
VNAGPGDTISEGGTFSSAGYFVDPGADSWTATVNYGDGSGTQTLALSANKTFSLNHVYAQDGLYTLTVTVTDSDGAAGSGTATVTVNNVAPVVNAGPDATINEGGSFSSSGSFTDPGADIWTATVDYGDSSGSQPLALNANKTFALNHTYAVQGTYTVTVTVQDSNGAAGSDTAIVTVNATTIPSCLSTLTARAKTGMVQLNWSLAEHTPTTLYDIYRSTEGPNSGFTKIRSGYTNKYPLFVNTGLVNGTTYYYRVEKSLAPAAAGYCTSGIVSGTPMGL